GSTRPNRNGEQVAHWVLEIASRRHDADFELVDLRDYPLPHLDEPLPPSFGQYANEHTKQWAAKIASFDGFVIVTPEYNHGTSGPRSTPCSTRSSPGAPRSHRCATPLPPQPNFGSSASKVPGGHARDDRPATVAVRA